jgi:hypothetical protein
MVGTFSDGMLGSFLFKYRSKIAPPLSASGGELWTGCHTTFSRSAMAGWIDACYAEAATNDLR